MKNYYTKLQKIKEKGSVDFIKFNYHGENIILKLVDGSNETISLLTKWRMEYRDMFGTDFIIDEEKTKKWIKNVILGNTDKILFVIYVNSKKIGVISHSTYNKENNSCMMDTMMKDPNFHLPGLMTTIEKIYLKWMFDEFSLSKITGFLFSDNEKMMNIHTKCGWKKIFKFTMNKIPTEEGWRWIKAEKNDGIREMATIEITKEELLSNFGSINYKILK